MIILVAILTFAVCFAGVWIGIEIAVDSFSLLGYWWRER